MCTRPPWPKTGYREKHPSVSQKLWLTPHLHSLEVVKLCLDVVMQPPPYFPGNRVKITALTRHLTQLQMMRTHTWSEAGMHKAPPETQLDAAKKLRVWLRPVTPPCHHHEGCRTARQAVIDWVTSSPAFIKLAGEEIKTDHESSEVL